MRERKKERKRKTGYKCLSLSCYVWLVIWRWSSYLQYHWGTADTLTYEECRLLGYKTPVRTPQQTHYVCATEPSRLMLCKIWGFHGGDYEECRLLRCKNPVLTSQETHYVSAIEPSRLMLCTIWSFHGDDYEECRLLGYKTPVRTTKEKHYVSAKMPSSLMLYNIRGFHDSDYDECLFWDVTPCGSWNNRCFGGTYRLQSRNVGSYKNHMESHTRRRHSSQLPPRKPQSYITSLPSESSLLHGTDIPTSETTSMELWRQKKHHVLNQ
jgi:hypothetical protein